MAQHKSAKTRIRRNARRTVINRNRVSRIRSFVRKVELAITSGDAGAARTAFQDAMPEMQRGVGKGCCTSIPSPASCRASAPGSRIWKAPARLPPSNRQVNYLNFY